jgi:methionyl-tRNA formyltransferase
MSARAARAVVFAYHDVGVRCLRTLLAHGVQVPLVVTHPDDPAETLWFESVARHASWHGLPVLAVERADTPGLLGQVAAAQPDFLFSFYFRSMLGESLLALPRRGAYNMHGSLLPRYRGRAPVNWAVLHGERETGATLHVMTAKPDAGAIVAQEAVPILPDDTALEVFRKVTVAAECALDRCLPALIAGSAPHVPQDLSAGSYYGRRTARDGAIDWRRGARAVHNLIRAVAPPYPGAFARAADLPLTVRRSLLGPAELQAAAPVLMARPQGLHALCHDGSVKLIDFELGADIRDVGDFRRRFGDGAVPLQDIVEDT